MIWGALGQVALGKETTAFAEGICTPLQELSEDVDRILHFKYFLKAREEATSTSTETKPKKENKYAHSFEVIKSMQDQFGRMAAGLQAFSKFVPEKVVRSIVRPGAPEARIGASPREMARQRPLPSSDSSPVSQHLLEPAFGVWVLECGVFTSREA